MNFKTIKFNIFFAIIISLISCDIEYHSVGTNLLFDQAFKSEKYTSEVFAFQEQLKSIQTDGLPLGLLGKVNHPIYGKTVASITSQLIISSDNPSFGRLAQDKEAYDPNNKFAIPENETVSSVYLDIPFYNNQRDRDNDGVIDGLDIDPFDPSSDSDGDGISDFRESEVGTNPLSDDSDNDGISDSIDEDSSDYDSENKNYEIDSVYGNPNAKFRMKVHELTYYLSSLDPQNNFESPLEYYSNTNYFDQGFYSSELFNEEVELNYDEVRVFHTEDDPETVDEIEDSTDVMLRYSPRIRLKLDPSFFQEKVINAEGSSYLRNSDNFKQYIKGIIIDAENFSEDIFLLLNLNAADIKINYDYDYYEHYGNEVDEDDEIIKKSSTFVINIGGVRVNTIKNSEYESILSSIAQASEESKIKEKIIIQGGHLYSKINLFHKNDLDNNDEIYQLRAKNNWLINEANLVFYIDSEMNDLNNENLMKMLPERLYLYNLNTGEPISDYYNDNSINLQATNANKIVYGGLLELDSNNKPWRYKFRITNHINNIIKNDSVNTSLALISGANISNLVIRRGINLKNEEVKYPTTGVLNPFGVKLIGSHTNNTFDEESKIKLEIFYTEY